MTPAWALRLVAQECERAGVKPPEVRWRRRKGYRSSSGTYYTGLSLILVRAGTDRRDQRMVLLHELAHHLAPPKQHHSPAFWRIAWEMYRRHRLTQYALIRERDYKAAATKVAVELHVPGARKAAKLAKVKRTQRKRAVCPMPADQAETQGYGTPHTHYVGWTHYYHGPDGSIAYWTGGRT